MIKIQSFRLVFYNEIDSTQSVARTLVCSRDNQRNDKFVIDAHSQYPDHIHATIVYTGRQTAGIGRMKRRWCDSEGNMALTIILSTDNLQNEKLTTSQHATFPLNFSSNYITQLPFVTAVALGNTISSVATQLSVNVTPQYKWVNDVYICGAKVAGILCELYGNYILIGVGVNVMHHPGTEETSPRITTSLAKNNIIIDADAFMHVFLDKFMAIYNEWIDGSWDKVRQTWIAGCMHIEEKINILYSNNDTYDGVFQSIDDNGCALLQLNNGIIRKIEIGDVTMI